MKLTLTDNHGHKFTWELDPEMWWPGKDETEDLRQAFVEARDTIDEAVKDGALNHV